MPVISRSKDRLLAALGVLILAGCHVSTDPISPKAQYSNSLGTLKAILEAQQRPSSELRLSEAIARTLKYNLDHRVAVAQTALESSNFKLAMMQMLPSITKSIDYSFRDNLLIQNLLQNGQVVAGDTSTTPRFLTQNGYQLKWSALDFGLSYVRAKQQSKRALISEEQRRKITQQLIQESTTAYWQAFTAQKMEVQVGQYKKRVKVALKRSQSITKEQTRSNQIELDYQQVLIKSIRRANALQKEIANAKIELSRLMNVHPQAKYRLKEPSYKMQRLPIINANLIKMDTIALISRPELREASYNTLIRKYGIEAAVMGVLPDVSFDYGWNQTNNMFMRNQVWTGGNVNVAWNILKAVLHGPQEIQSAKYGVEFEKIKQAANTISVLAQVRVALVNYNLWREDYNFALQEFKVSKQLLTHAQNLEQAEQGNEQVTIQRGLDKLNAEFDSGITHAKAQAALYTLYQSVGVDIMPSYANYLSLNELIKLVSKVSSSVSNGAFNQMVSSRYQTLLPQLGAPNVKETINKKDGKSTYEVMSPIELTKAGVVNDVAKAVNQSKATNKVASMHKGRKNISSAEKNKVPLLGQANTIKIKGSDSLPLKNKNQTHYKMYHSLQIATFSNHIQAKHFLRYLKKNGFDAFLSERKSKNGKLLIRVVMGHSVNKSEIKQLQDDLSHSVGIKGLIVSHHKTYSCGSLCQKK